MLSSLCTLLAELERVADGSLADLQAAEAGLAWATSDGDYTWVLSALEIFRKAEEAHRISRRNVDEQFRMVQRAQDSLDSLRAASFAKAVDTGRVVFAGID